MPLDFPGNPTIGQPFRGRDGTVWYWDGQKWAPGTGPTTWEGGGTSGFGDAPFDGMLYGRRRGQWEPALPLHTVIPGGVLRLDASIVLDLCGEFDCVASPSLIAPNVATEQLYLNAYPHKMTNPVYLTDGGAGNINVDSLGNMDFQVAAPGIAGQPIAGWTNIFKLLQNGNIQLPVASCITWNQPPGTSAISICGNSAAANNQLIISDGAYDFILNDTVDPVWDWYNTGTPGVSPGSQMNLTSTGNLNVRQNITAGLDVFVTQNLYINPDNGWEWYFTVDGNGDKVEYYRGTQWYDLWASSNGTRYWVGPAGGSPNTVNNLMTLDGGGNLNAFATIKSLGARVISFGVGGNPSVSVWDDAQNAAAGMFFGASGNLDFGNMDGDGNYGGDLFASMNAGGMTVYGIIGLGTSADTAYITYQDGSLLFNAGPNTYFGYDAPSESWVWVTGGVGMMTLDGAGNLTIRGNISALNVAP